MGQAQSYEEIPEKLPKCDFVRESFVKYIDHDYFDATSKKYVTKIKCDTFDENLLLDKSHPNYVDLRNKLKVYTTYRFEGNYYISPSLRTAVSVSNILDPSVRSVVATVRGILNITQEITGAYEILPMFILIQLDLCAMLLLQINWLSVKNIILHT